jgi:CubicO group peptidase (beta-lactamase class C family)
MKTYSLPAIKVQLLAAVAFSSLAVPAFAQDVATQTPELADLEAVINDTLKLWNTHGVAVAVVKDGQVILSKGYGQRDAEKQLPMTSQTVMPVASVTKSFTVASLATLVRDGKLEWDKPVRDIMPDFRMQDHYAMLNITPRDLVTHRSGLPRHDFSWFGSTATREQLYKRIQHFEPSAQLRTTFQYNNFMYMTAGYLGGKIAGSTWEDLVRESLFRPLGMKNSSFTIDDVLKEPDHGTGYRQDDDDKPFPIAYQQLTAMGPTGSINSNAENMSRYLRMLLGQGKFEGRTILNASDIVEMTNPQMVIADARRFSEISSTQYGMGFFLTHYRGERLVHHGGNMPGSSSLLSFMPQRNVGVWVSTNMSGSSIPSIVSYAIYDRLLKLQAINWNERFKEIDVKGKASRKDAVKQNLTPRKSGTTPAHPLDAYVAEYDHPGYGVIGVSRSNDDLAVTYNGFRSPLKHFHYEVWQAPRDERNDLSEFKLTFVTSVDGEVNSISAAMESAVKPVIFNRLPDKSLSDKSLLAKLAGVYELGATKVTVLLRDDGFMTLAIPGQATRELLPLAVTAKGKKYSVKGLNGFSVEFVESNNAFDQMAFYQPNGNFVAQRAK